jgi:hypothetical protein
VERWNPFARKRLDLFGGIDIVAIKVGEPVMGVQATTGDHVAERVEKIQDVAAMCIWREVARLEVHGWRKVGRRGERKTWDVRRIKL